MSIEQEKMIVESLSSIYPMQKFEEDAIEVVLDALPSAQPKRGKWILKSYRWECDQCGCLIRRASPFKGNEWNYNFCPNCGADMREVTT